MIMKKLRRYLATAVLALFGMTLSAQEVSPVDFMRLNPYQLVANPATDLPYEAVMSMFIGNVNLNFHNTGLHYDNLFDFDAQGRPQTVNLHKLADGLKPNNYLGLDFNENIFMLSRRVKKGLMTYSHNVRAQVGATYNDGLFKLLAYGNGAFVGDDNPAVVDMKVDAHVFQEFALGYQYNVTEQLSLGGWAKLLFGFGNVKSDAATARLYTDPDSYALRLQEEVALKASLPSLFCIKDDELITRGNLAVADLFRNPGFGLDFAAEYRFDERFSAVAAVRDLGFISWGANNFERTGDIDDNGQFYDNGDFLFSGIDGEQLNHIVNDEAYRKAFLDTLQGYFRIRAAEKGRYATPLHTNLLLRGNYDLDANNRFIAQVQGRFTGCGFRPALTLAYSGSFWNNLNVCATYTMMPNSYANFGLGLSAMIETCNIYVTTNNLIGCFNPLNSSNVNAQVGIVFNLFLPEKRFIDESGRPQYLNGNDGD